MMWNDMAQLIYAYIIKVELIFIRLYKINPIDTMNHMSVLDLHTYITSIMEAEKKERNSTNNKHIMECLKGVSDYLNFMFYNK